MELYVKGLDSLRRDHPRTPTSPDLECDDTNWSEFFEISYDGLILISVFSRYAEFWAERSFRSKEVFHSFEARKIFMDSKAHHRFYELWCEDKLVLVDDFTNGVTSFDFLQQVARYGLSQRETFCRANKWRTLFWSEEADAAFGQFTTRDWEAATLSA
jgi:hypothetical protein